MKRINPTKIDKVIFAGILVLLVFAPLAFGSVHTWAYGMIEFGVFLLLALWFVDRLIVSSSAYLWEVYPEDRIVFGIVPDENEEMKSLVLKEIAMRNGM